jgi:acyl-coenzyme A thioesterase PaaI-like protein
VLDTTAGFALMCAIGERFKDESSTQILARFQRMGTIDLRIDYLRQGMGSRFVSTATITRLGGRVASTQMALHNDQGELIATGAAAYVVS